MPFHYNKWRLNEFIPYIIYIYRSIDTFSIMKYLFSLLLGILFSLQTFAQDSKFEIGIQGGPNISNIPYKYKTAKRCTTITIRLFRSWQVCLFNII